MLSSYVVHYKNKYPNGKVDASDDRLDVYCADGVHRVALRKGGDGVIRDKSNELGAIDKHDLSPIPKNTRVYKLHADGRIGLDEEASARIEASRELVQADNRILSIEEYKKMAGYTVDQIGNVQAPK
ncbi:hypothetical protein AZI87_11960 [Bdellovibrio bacteriovorus]|uniref:Uncharacterized protein n=1 Tax=Bdellovibrio bacteriovorus TaxID=959 RepID=A0A162G8A7_BDEBC|nr:hypothetical protein [Bdellovibrio bacteriovorus]KYG65263.1 hypothetical protein AZI87_11960 [Bdellovibrio bacteriovorus]